MRHQTTPRDVRLADLAQRQYGIVADAQLHEIGLDRAAIRRRVRFVSLDSDFTAELDLDSDGFVLHYPELAGRV